MDKCPSCSFYSFDGIKCSHCCYKKPLGKLIISEIRVWKNSKPEEVKEIEVPPQTMKLKAIEDAIAENEMKRKLGQ